MESQLLANLSGALAATGSQSRQPEKRNPAIRFALRIFDLEIKVQKIFQHRVLPEAEVRRLIRAAQNGDVQSRNEVVCSHLKYAKYFAVRFSQGRLPVNEGFQLAVLAVIHAITKYDPTGVKFSTYAYYWIKSFVLREIHCRSRVIKLPDDWLCQVRSSNITKRTKQAMLRVASDSFVDIDNCEDEEQPKDREPSPLHLAERTEIRESLGKLDRRSSEILWRRASEETSEEIGLSLGISRERVRQIESRALRKLAIEMGRVSPVHSSMADVLFSQSPTRPFYKQTKLRRKWSLWLNGESHELHRGRDFSDAPSMLIRGARRSAAALGIEVEAKHNGNGTVILRAKLKQKS